MPKSRSIELMREIWNLHETWLNASGKERIEIDSQIKTRAEELKTLRPNWGTDEEQEFQSYQGKVEFSNKGAVDQIAAILAGEVD